MLYPLTLHCLDTWPFTNAVVTEDVRGNVLVWAVDNEEHTVKHELQPLNGRINGIAWDSMNSRLAIVGEGREKLRALPCFLGGGEDSIARGGPGRLRVVASFLCFWNL